VIIVLITKIEEQKKNKKRCSIYVDDEYYCSVDREILKEVNLSEGIISENEFARKMDIINYKTALKAALTMLVRAPRTEKELSLKLRQKGLPDSAIQKAVEYLKGTGYINDEAYAESVIRSSKDIKGCSSNSLYSKLSQKGIDSETIRKKINEADFDEYSSALKAAQKKLQSLKGSSKDKAAKLMSFLFRKGFGMDTCKKVLDSLELQDDDIANFTEFFE